MKTNFNKPRPTWERSGVCTKKVPISTSLRLRYGLFWKHATPPIARPIFAVFTILLLYTLASTLDYYYQQATVLEQVVAVYEPQVKVLKDCERGAAGYYYADGKAFECGGKL